MSAGTNPERRGRRARLSMVGPGKGVGDNCAKAPLALSIRLERVLEGLLVEVRPQAVGEVQLGVRALPQQEVAQAPLAAGANQQIHLGRRRQGMIDVREPRGEARTVDAGLGLQAPAGLEEAMLRGVVHGDAQMHATAMRARLLAALDLPACAGRSSAASR